MILQRVREETHSAHKQLEANIDLLGRSWSMPFYQELLKKFYGFYASIEPLVFLQPQWQQLQINTQKRLKTHWLREDLCTLGLSIDAIQNLPLCQKVPSIQNFAQALGSAYVLEGSTLGGQIISRHLRRELGVEPHLGSVFFSSYGENVGSMWREFIEVLNTYPLDENEQNQLVQSAKSTFTTFDEWLRDIL